MFKNSHMVASRIPHITLFGLAILATHALVAQGNLPKAPYVGSAAGTFSTYVTDNSFTPPYTYAGGNGCSAGGRNVPVSACIVSATQGFGYTATASAGAAYNRLSYAGQASSVAGASPSGSGGSYAGIITQSYFRDLVTITGPQLPTSLIFHISEVAPVFTATLGSDALAAADSSFVAVFATPVGQFYNSPPGGIGELNIDQVTTGQGSQVSYRTFGTWKSTDGGGVVTYFAPGGGNIAQFDFEMLTGSQASLYFGPSSRTTVGDASFSDVDPLHLTAIDAFDANGNPLDVQFSFASGVDYGLGPSTSTVPEPSELALLASGFAGLGVVVRRRRT